MDTPHQEEKPEPKFAETLHERAREAGTEQRKLLISLSTGCLAVFFLALTTKVDPALTPFQQLTACAALYFMAFAIVAGILAWRFDARRNYFWARANQQNTIPEFKRFLEVRDNFYKLMSGFTFLLRLLFTLGALFSALYVTLRLFQP